jgi:hypothetical protein
MVLGVARHALHRRVEVLGELGYTGMAIEGIEAAGLRAWR